MKRDKKSVLAVVLIGLGVLIALGKIGFGFGWWMGYAIPLVLIAIGYVGIRKDWKWMGWPVLILGALVLLGKFLGVFGWIAAVLLILFGLNLLRK